MTPKISTFSSIGIPTQKRRPNILQAGKEKKSSAMHDKGDKKLQEASRPRGPSRQKQSKDKDKYPSNTFPIPTTTASGKW